MKIVKIVNSRGTDATGVPQPESTPESLTARGWKLVQILDRASRVQRESIPLPAEPGVSQPMYGYATATRYREEAHVVCDPLFVFEKDEEIEARDAALEKRAVTAETELAAALANTVADRQAHDAAVKRLTDEVKKLNEHVEYSRTAARDRASECAELRAQLKKAREAVGELKWREIFPPAETAK